jgi:flagellar biosynthesis/type III secretory pathway protein FliH
LADPRRRGDWAGLALVFAEAAGTREAWKQALEGWNVEVSQQVLEWQAEALQRGLAEGEARGEAKAKAEAVIGALRLRFGKKLPKKLQQAIAQTTALDQLNRWFEAAITAPSLDAFRVQAGL